MRAGGRANHRQQLHRCRSRTAAVTSTRRDVGGTTEIQKGSSPAVSARANHGESQVVLVPAAWRQASVSAWLLKSLLRARSSGKRERGVYLRGGDVLRIWVYGAEAAEKFLGAQVVLGVSHLSCPVRYRSPGAPDITGGKPGFAGIPVRWPRLCRAHPGSGCSPSVVPVGAWRVLRPTSRVVTARRE